MGVTTPVSGSLPSLARVSKSREGKSMQGGDNTPLPVTYSAQAIAIATHPATVGALGGDRRLEKKIIYDTDNRSLT